MNISRNQLEALPQVERDLTVKATPELAEDRQTLHQVIAAIEPKPHLTRIDLLIMFEPGDLDNDAVIDLFQSMIDDGTVWHLQGCYARYADQLIRAGYCVLPPESRTGVLDARSAGSTSETQK